MVEHQNLEQDPIDFITDSIGELQKYRVSEDIARLEALGLKVEGTLYFQDLLSNDELTPSQQLESIFVGSVALGHVTRAEEAKARYFGMRGKSMEARETLGRKLFTAIGQETKLGNREAVSRLKSADAALGELLKGRGAVVPLVGGMAVGPSVFGEIAV